MHLDPVKRKQFKQFVNTEERRSQSEMITERGQQRPADWAKAYPPSKLTQDRLVTPKSDWMWLTLVSKADMMPTDTGTTNVAVKYGETQLAVFHVPKRGYFATQQM
jgi:nitrite reductase (NAD(P)H)